MLQLFINETYHPEAVPKTICFIADDLLSSPRILSTTDFLLFGCVCVIFERIFLLFNFEAKLPQKTRKLKKV